MLRRFSISAAVAATVLLTWGGSAKADDLTRIKYNNPGLTVDLGVGLWAWPLPMDYDGDGDIDLVVSSGGVPYKGTYFFENPGAEKGKLPVFKPGVRIGEYMTSAQISPDGTVMTPNAMYPDFKTNAFENPIPIGIEMEDIHQAERTRAKEWKLVDYDGDGVRDLIVGVGDWDDYGWDDAFNAKGEWTRGPLHGYVYWLKGKKDGGYGEPLKVEAGGEPVDVFGMPTPNFADFDGDGDLDLLCGEFLDGFTYFENKGTRTAPKYAKGRRLKAKMDLEMITPVAVDFDGDGDPDLVVGDEDGRVAFIENLGGAKFGEVRYFQQEAEYVKFGALVTPIGFDWDDDGDEDIVAGNSAGYIAFIENLGGGDDPKWAAPAYLDAGGERIRIQAGYNGSIQGPAEAKWGYTTISVVDWNGDGLPDILANSIWGKVIWYENVGTRKQPKLAKAQSVLTTSKQNPAWNWWSPKNGELATQWRTTPTAVDWNGDGRMDLVMLDAEGYLAVYAHMADGRVADPERSFLGDGVPSFDRRNNPLPDAKGPFGLNEAKAGSSGRRKLAFVDWDGDGRLDLLVNSKSIDWFRNTGERDGKTLLRHEGPLSDQILAGHTTSPTVVDWDDNDVPDLLIGAEDGFLYYKKNPRAE